MTLEKVIDRIIKEEVFTNAGELIHDLTLSLDFGDKLHDWNNLYLSDEEIIEDFQLWGDDIDNLIQDVRERGEDCQEILEFWLVSPWLAEQLKLCNAPTLEFKGLYFWGRTESGQSLTLDYRLNQIARKLERR